MAGEKKEMHSEVEGEPSQKEAFRAITTKDIVRIAVLWTVVIVVSVAALIVINTFRFTLLNTVQYSKRNPYLYARALSLEGEKYYRNCLEKSIRIRDQEKTSLLVKGDPDLERAKELLTRSLTINPANTYLYKKLAELASLEGNKVTMAYFLGMDRLTESYYDEAIHYFEEVLSREPDHLMARENLARTLWKKGESEAALDLLNAALEQSPDFAPGYQLLGEIQISLKQTDLALEAFEHALQINDQNVTTAKLIARILFARKAHDKALTYLSGAETIAPYDANLKHLIGINLYALERYPDCKKKLKEALRLERNSSELYLDLARVYQKLGKTHYSNMMLQKAIELNPSIKSGVLFGK